MTGIIHKYQLKGFNLVVDTNSGGVHIVDNVVYDLLDYITPPFPERLSDDIFHLLKKYSEEELKDAYEEIRVLYEDDVLYSEDDYQKFANMMVSAPIKSMCLHVAHDCNLRCKYCFASTGDFGEGRKLLDVETGKKAIDFLLNHSKGRHNLELDFFGGEPLMNTSVIKEIVQYARSKEKEYNKNFRFTTTTNGVLLDDETIDYLNDEMYNIVLSIDGRKEVNDRMRPAVNGKGSYDIIMPKFKEFRKKRGDGQYYVRGTYTKYNLDFAEDVKHFYEEGFDQISVEPVVTDSKMEYALTEEELPRIYAEYESLADYIIEKKKNGECINFFHFMLDLDQGPCAIKRLRGCGCGNEYVAVTPDGDIYPCHQFVGMEEWKMGSVYDGSLDLKMKDEFARVNVYNKEDCQKCWAKFYCSGGCNANNFQYAGDVRKPFKLSCDLEKKRLECAIMIKAALAQDD